MNAMHSGGSNRKWIGGLVVVIGIGLVFAALSSGGSSTLLSFLPFLLILACPLMMIFMMGSMGSMGHGHSAGSALPPGSTSEDLPNLTGLSPDQQMRTLRHELTCVAWRQEALRQTLAKVQAEQRAERGAGADNMTGAR
jgi:hypothetical protein